MIVRWVMYHHASLLIERQFFPKMKASGAFSHKLVLPDLSLSHRAWVGTQVGGPGSSKLRR